MNVILKGEEAKKICQEILDHFYLDGTYNKHIGSKGYFLEQTLDRKKEVVVAFDNSSADCWIEQFDDINSAIRWLNF